jgi:hypothetical protein
MTNLRAPSRFASLVCFSLNGSLNGHRQMWLRDRAVAKGEGLLAVRLIELLAEARLHPVVILHFSRGERLD